MTHTSTEQPEALRLADICAKKGLFAVEDELRRLHARMQELEASQAQLVPLDADAVQTIMLGAGYSVWDMKARADFINGIRHGEEAHGITQEKQG